MRRMWVMNNFTFEEQKNVGNNFEHYLNIEFYILCKRTKP